MTQAAFLSAEPPIQGKGTGGRIVSYDPQIPEELRVRGGLPNFFAKLAAGKPVAIAYLGGSITAANGWRPKTLAWFRAQFPKSEITEINAAISGTGSDYGACRLSGDVLVRNPDLVFMEHRVNGGGGYEAKSVEGIVRQIWKKNPETDICLVYTIHQPMLKDFYSNRTPRFGEIMERVANGYGIPSIDFGPEVVALEKADKLIFKTNAAIEGKISFAADGTHPGDAGHDIYRDVLARSMLVIRQVTGKNPHTLPAVMNPGCWEETEIIPFDKVSRSPGWSLVDTNNDPIYREDFGRTHAMLRGAIKSDKVGETLTVKWRGTTIGFSDIPYGEPMEIEVSVDGADPIPFKRTQNEKKKYSRFFYLPEFAAGAHTAILKIKSLREGSAFYSGQVLVIGKSSGN